jgi:predicted PurR-regulated permease PerM
MLVALVAGISAFGVAGIVLGPSILGFVKAMADTLFGEVRYETSLLKSEDVVQEQRAIEQARVEAASVSD